MHECMRRLLLSDECGHYNGCSELANRNIIMNPLKLLSCRYYAGVIGGVTFTFFESLKSWCCSNISCVFVIAIEVPGYYKTCLLAQCLQEFLNEFGNESWFQHSIRVYQFDKLIRKNTQSLGVYVDQSHALLSLTALGQ